MRVFSLASQLASGYCTKIGNGIKNYCKLHAEEQDEHARLTGWRYECGSLWGLINTLEYDGVLDAAVRLARGGSVLAAHQACVRVHEEKQKATYASTMAQPNAWKKGIADSLTARPAREKPFASRSVPRALLTPWAKHGPLYRRGEST